MEEPMVVVAFVVAEGSVVFETEAVIGAVAEVFGEGMRVVLVLPVKAHR